MGKSIRNEAISYLKQGNNEYRNGRFVQAIKYYSKAIDTDSMQCNSVSSNSTQFHFIECDLIKLDALLSSSLEMELK